MVFPAKALNLFRGGGLRAQLLRGGVGSATIKASSLVLGLVLSIVLARMLGVKHYGVYAYAIAILNLIMLAADAGAPALLMREVSASQGRGEWGLLRGALIRSSQLVVLTSLCIAVIGFVVVWVMVDRLSHDQLYTIYFMLLMLPVLALGRTIVYAMRGFQHIVASQALELSLRPLLVLLIVTGVFFAYPTFRLPQVAMAAQFSAVLMVLVIAFLVFKRVLPEPARNAPAEYRTRYWLKSSLHFALIGGAGVIYSQADIIMLGWFGSTANVGIYRVAIQGAALVSFGLQAANIVLAPQFARLYAQEDMAKLQRLVTVSARIILLMALPVALAFLLAGGIIVNWVFGPDYSSAYIPLAILTIGQLINAGFGSVGFLLNMTGHEKISARVLWQTAGLNIFLNAILIPVMGMAGAAIATAMCIAFWNGLLFVAVRQQLRLNSTAFSLRI